MNGRSEAISITEKIHCNTCGIHTNHKVEYSHSRSWHEELDDEACVRFAEKYDWLVCLGCGSGVIRLLDSSSIYDDQTTFYPPRSSRRKPRWLTGWRWDGNLDLGDSDVKELLREIYVALHQDSRRLAGMGLRSLVEYVMIEKVGDRGSFTKNLEAMLDEGYISRRQSDRLKILIEAGHATTHRAWRPSTEDIHIIMDIVEHMIESIHIHDHESKAIDARIPKRVRSQ